MEKKENDIIKKDKNIGRFTNVDIFTFEPDAEEKEKIMKMFGLGGDK